MMYFENLLLDSKNISASDKMKSMKYQDDNADNNLKCSSIDLQKILLDKKKLLEMPRLDISFTLSVANWKKRLGLAEVIKVGKNLTKNYTVSINKTLYLLPEECFCLLEMRRLELRWKNKPLSIQKAYTLILSSKSNYTINYYRTYSYLVKLGFRVFRGLDDAAKQLNEQTDPIAAIDNSEDKKFVRQKSLSKFQDRVFVPRVQPGLLKLVTPHKDLLPYNLQPRGDYYSFNLSLSGSGLKIVQMKSIIYEHKEKTPFVENKTIVYKSQPSGVYPVYEENKPVVAENDDDVIYEPDIKRFKMVPYTSCLISSTYRKGNQNHHIDGSVKIVEFKKQKCSDDFEVTDSPSTHERIMRKLKSIKSVDIKEEYNNLTIDKHRPTFDVFYPDNDFPKTKKPLPDFRVILYDHEEPFPNVYKESITYRFGNCTLLWAVVNSNSVSFFEVCNSAVPDHLKLNCQTFVSNNE